MVPKPSVRIQDRHKSPPVFRIEDRGKAADEALASADCVILQIAAEYQPRFGNCGRPHVEVGRQIDVNGIRLDFTRLLRPNLPVSGRIQVFG